MKNNRSREKTKITIRYSPTVVIQEEPKFRHVFFSLLFSIMILLWRPSKLIDVCNKNVNNHTPQRGTVHTDWLSHAGAQGQNQSNRCTQGWLAWISDRLLSSASKNKHILHDKVLFEFWFCFLLFKSRATYKGGNISTFGSTAAIACRLEGKDLKMKSKEAGDAPQLCPDGELSQGKLQPAWCERAR